MRTLPAASALRAGFPEARLSWLVEPPAASLLAGQPWLDQVLVFPRDELQRGLRRGAWLGAARRAIAFLRELRSAGFDLVVDFHAILRSALLARASGASCRVSYARPFAREGAAWLATERARLRPRRQSRFQRNLALVRYLGVDAAPARRPLQLPEERLRRMAEQLGTGAAPVVLHPGTSPATPYKRWSAEDYAELARGLRRSEGLASVVSVGPARWEREFAERVVRGSAGAARLAPSTPSLLDLAALLARARLYIGSDTGPMHVASLVGTPVVQLLGPTDPVENEPWSATPSRTVRVPLACSPCRRGCAAATCMRSIRPRSVLEAARELLAAERQLPRARRREGGR